MKRLLTLFAIVALLGGCATTDFTKTAGPPPQPLPPTGTGAELSAGTETANRLWAPDVLSTAFSGATTEVADATVGDAGNGDTAHAYSKDDIRDYAAQHDSDFDGLPDGTEDGVVTAAMLASTLDISGKTVTFGLTDSDVPTTLTLETISGTPVITNGAAIGTDDTNHLIDEASNGAGSATLYIGNESILASGDIGVSVLAPNGDGSGLSGVVTSESDPNALLTAGTDNVKDTHIDWGTGAGQVSADDIPDGSTYAIVTLTQESNWDTHLSSTGADHSYIDQDVTSGSSPTFTATNITGFSAGIIDAITEIASGLKSGSDTTLITGTAGTNTYVAVWNADGDLVAGTGPPLTNPMTTQGDIIYGGSSGVPTRLAAGTANSLLGMNSGATAPEWKSSISIDIVLSDQTPTTDGLFTKTANDQLALGVGGASTNYFSPTKDVAAGLGDSDVHTLSEALINDSFQPLSANLTTWAGVTPGTGIAAALAVNVGSAGAPVLYDGALGTPSGGVGTNLTALDDDNVDFDDVNSDWTATAIGPALEEMVDSINGGVPNSATAKVHWSQLTGVPAGFADGTDDTGSGSLGSNLSSSTDDILSDNGTILLGGTGNTNNETLDFDFETSANTVGVSTTSGVTLVDFGAIGLAGGSFDASGGNITNVGNIALDSLSADTILHAQAPNIRLAFDAAAYLNVATTDGGGTVISQTSDGIDTIDIGDTGDQVRIVGVTAGANDGYYDGIVRTYTVDSGQTETSFGQAYHVDTDGELIVADGDVASQGSMPAIGLAVETGTGAKKVLLQGLICETDWAWTVGGPVYVSDDPSTTEGLTQTAISTTGDTVQLVGIAVTADCIEVSMGGYNWIEVP